MELGPAPGRRLRPPPPDPGWAQDSDSDSDPGPLLGSRSLPHAHSRPRFGPRPAPCPAEGPIPGPGRPGRRLGPQPPLSEGCRPQAPDPLQTRPRADPARLPVSRARGLPGGGARRPPRRRSRCGRSRVPLPGPDPLQETSRGRPMRRVRGQTLDRHRSDVGACPPGRRAPGPQQKPPLCSAL